MKQRIQKRWDTFVRVLFPSLQKLMAYKGSTYADESDEHANYRVLATWGLTDSAAHSAFNRCVEKSFRLSQVHKHSQWKRNPAWARKQVEDLIACQMIVWKELYELETHAPLG